MLCRQFSAKYGTPYPDKVDCQRCRRIMRRDDRLSNYPATGPIDEPPEAGSNRRWEVPMIQRSWDDDAHNRDC